MKVFILTLVVLGLVYYFWWGKFTEWMDARNLERRRQELLSVTTLVVEEDGSVRYKLEDSFLPTDGLSVQAMRFNGVWLPVMQLRCQAKSVFGPTQMVLDANGRMSHILFNMGDVLQSDDHYLVTKGGALIETICKDIAEVKLVDAVRVMVLGGDFTRQYTIADEELARLQGMIELAQILNKQS